MLLGIGMPFYGMMSACRGEDDLTPSFTGSVLVIGAGAGGLSAGYYLRQHGIDVQILEASSSYGGRMKIDISFADFPIPLGAEWIESKADILDAVANDPSVNIEIETTSDPPDLKFVNYSWFHFFEDYIVPSIEDRISYDTVVESIDYTGDQIEVITTKGRFLADKVIISVPLKVLQLGDIGFIPALPSSKQMAIRDAVVWDGFKAFFEFKNNFYGDSEYTFDSIQKQDGQKIYYNAALGQRTTRNILGLFAVGMPAQELKDVSADDLKSVVLHELDGIYDNQASLHYHNHIVQDWQKEPFIKGGYLSDFADERMVRELGRSVDQKIYFAGGAFTDGEDWVSVHTAAASAKKAVEEILRS